MIETNWVVITGEPRSGKSTLIERLAFYGYRICPEVSRIVIDDYRSKEIYLDCYADNFENIVLSEKLAAEKRFQPKECVFWDRSIIDSIAFSRFYKRGLDDIIKKSLKYKYRFIFYLCELPIYQPDYATIENKETAKILGKYIRETYKENGYLPVMVPKMDVESRVQFVLDIIHNNEK